MSQVQVPNNPGNDGTVEVAGLRTWEEFVFHFSYGQSVSTDTVLGNQAGATLTQLYSATGATLYVDSSSTKDTATGTGLRTFRVWGVDITDHLQTLVTSPVGTTGTAIDGTWKTVFFMEGLTCGSDNVTQGNVFLQDDAAGTNKYLGIPASGVRSSWCKFFIPPTMSAAFHFEGYVTCDTTATDSVQVKARKIIPSGPTTYSYDHVLSVNCAAASGTVSGTFEGALTSGVTYDFYANDTGTTGQDLNWALTLALKYK